MLAKKYTSIDSGGESTSLLLHGDGIGGSTNIVDSSKFNRNVSIIGNDVKIDTTIKKYGSGSILFTGTGYGLHVDDDAINIPENTDFTIESWVYPVSFAGVPRILSSASDMGSIQILIYSNGVLGVEIGDFEVGFSGMPALTMNTWSHIALVRKKGYSKIFVDGVGSNSYFNNMHLLGINFTIGAYRREAGYQFAGYMDEFRIVKGDAIYDQSFTPPTSPFLI